MTKLYRVEAYVTDINDDNPNVDDVVDALQNCRAPEFLHVESIQETDVGEWYDEHELNQAGCNFRKYFPDTDAGPLDANLKREHARVKTLMLKGLDDIWTLRLENDKLKRELEKLKKVQEFVKTIGDLTR